MDPHTLKQLYYQMFRIRLVEEKIAELYPEQEMRCPVHLCIGQEAVAAGVCANLSEQDYVFSAHRSHGHYLAKGGSLEALMAELYGKETGCSHGRGGSMHLIDLGVGFLASTPIIGSTIPMAVGSALASKMKGESRISVVFFGEAATEEGTFHEAANFASLEKLPVLFVCENNLYSVYSPLSVRQPRREVINLAKGHGIEGKQADGNDVTAVYAHAKRAIEIIHSEGGPYFLEFKTYRWREHCGPHYDNDLGYRSEREFQEWKARCPIQKLESQLLREHICSESDLAEFKNEINSKIQQAVKFAKESPFPEEKFLLKHIFHEF